MELVRLKIKDFLGIRNAEIDFENRGLFVIQGVNGAGKTSILESVYYALFEKSFRFLGNTKSELVNVYSIDGISVIELTMKKSDGTVILIKRFIGKNSRYMSVTQPDGTIIELTKTEEIRDMVAKLGFYPQNFKYSVILPQGGANAFIEAKKEEKRRVLEVFLNLEKIESGREAVAKDAAELYGRIRGIKEEIESIEKEEIEKKREEANDSIKGISAALAENEILLKAINKEMENLQETGKIFEEKKQYSLEIYKLKSEAEKMVLEAEADMKTLKAKEIVPDYMMYKNLAEKLQESEKQTGAMKNEERKLTADLDILKETILEKKGKYNVLEERYTAVLRDFQEKKEKYKRIDTIPAKLEVLSSSKEKLENEIGKTDKKISKIIEQLHIKNEELSELSIRAANDGKVLREMEERAEKAEKEAAVEKVSELILRDHMPLCPVCGGDTANVTAGRKYEMTEFAKMIKEYERNHSKILSAITVLEGDIKRDNISLQDEKDKISEYERELADIKRNGKELADILRQNGFRNIEEAKEFSKYAAEQEKLIKGIENERSTLEKEISIAENSIVHIENNLQTLRDKMSDISANALKLKKECETAKAAYMNSLNEKGVNEDEFLTLAKRTVTGALEKLTENGKKRSELESKIEILNDRCRGYNEEEIKNSLELQISKIEELKTESQNLYEERGRKAREIEELAKKGIRLDYLRSSTAETEREFTKLTLLKDYLAPSRFPRYIMSKFLKKIIEETNKNLELLTRGRYKILSNEEMDISVVDIEKGGIERSVESLSGGEKTMISLGISFAIADNISRGIKFFFIDEGFSPLDRDNLRYVYENLNEFVKTGKIVGIITHDRDFAECFEERLTIRKGGEIIWH